MNNIEKSRRSTCPISCALDMLGDKWTLLVIRDLLFFHKRTYGEMLASSERISTNILAERLKKLEYEGLIKKSVDRQNRSKYIYQLTKQGIELLPVMLELISWSARHISKASVPPAFIECINNDREGIIRKIKALQV